MTARNDAGNWVDALERRLVESRTTNTNEPAADSPAAGILSRRSTYTSSIAALCLGTLMVCLGSKSGDQFLSPGELTSAHSGLAQGCAACHTAGELTRGDVSGLIGCALESDAMTESRKCITCHSFGGSSLSPHSLPGELLASITASFSQPAAASHAQPQPDHHHAAGVDAQLACATCHREHGGRNANLSHLTDTQCQTCHRKTFDSFEHGHPEFADYPHERRPRIHFDHATHYGQHFLTYERIMPGGRAPESCRTCHQSDASGEAMGVVGYAQGCAGCHDRQIEDHVSDGVEFLSIPAIPFLESAEAVESSEQPLPPGIGVWPTDGGRLSPLLRLLLSIDEKFVQAERVLHPVQPSETNTTGRLDPIEFQQAAEDYARSIKRLLFDLETKREAALEERLRSVAARNTSFDELLALPGYAGLGDAFFHAVALANRRWFPTLSEELRQHQQGSLTPTAPDANESRQEVQPQAEAIGPWKLDRRRPVLYYSATGHADPVLTAWLELAVAQQRMLGVGGASTSSISRSQDAILGSLGQWDATGRCLKCHTVDRLEDGTQRVNWLSRRPALGERRFTRFRHAPHLVGESADKCDSCHQVSSDFQIGPNRDFTTVEFLPELNPHSKLSSGLDAITRQGCLKCHAESKTDSNCVSCHTYHVSP